VLTSESLDLNTHIDDGNDNGDLVLVTDLPLSTDTVTPNRTVRVNTYMHVLPWYLAVLLILFAYTIELSLLKSEPACAHSFVTKQRCLSGIPSPPSYSFRL